jgi:hypothetical protein
VWDHLDTCRSNWTGLRRSFLTIYLFSLYSLDQLAFAGLAFLLLLLFLSVHIPRTPLKVGTKAMDWFGIVTILGVMVIGLLAAGCCMGVFFIWSEKSLAKYPLIPLGLFTPRNQTFLISSSPFFRILLVAPHSPLLSIRFSGVSAPIWNTISSYCGVRTCDGCSIWDLYPSYDAVRGRFRNLFACSHRCSHVSKRGDGSRELIFWILFREAFAQSLKSIWILCASVVRAGGALWDYDQE